jgi:transposase-like protein
MSIRLQVVMEDAELDAIRAVARERGMTVSQWVRETLRQARREVSSGDAERKLAAVRAADRHAYPTADIDQMVAEIERGYGEANE